MAVTETEERVSESEEEPGRAEESGRASEFGQADESEQAEESGRAEESEQAGGSEETGESEGPGARQSDRGEKSGESEESDEAESAPKPSHLLRKVAGGVAVFLLLGIYFVWIGSEMGAHATAGSTEMWAIFGGILLGVVAALAGGAMMRRNN